MASPIIFIATNRLKAGQLARERDRVPGLVRFIEAGEPRLIAFNEYANEAGDEVTVVQIHPDAASLEAHMEIVRERAQQAYAETLDATIRIQVFGRPTDAILERAPPAGRKRRRNQRQPRAHGRLHPLGRPPLRSRTHPWFDRERRVVEHRHGRHPFARRGWTTIDDVRQSPGVRKVDDRVALAPPRRHGYARAMGSDSSRGIAQPVGAIADSPARRTREAL